MLGPAIADGTQQGIYNRFHRGGGLTDAGPQRVRRSVPTALIRKRTLGVGVGGNTNNDTVADALGFHSFGERVAVTLLCGHEARLK